MLKRLAKSYSFRDIEANTILVMLISPQHPPYQEPTRHEYTLDKKEIFRALDAWRRRGMTTPQLYTKLIQNYRHLFPIGGITFFFTEMAILLEERQNYRLHPKRLKIPASSVQIEVLVNRKDENERRPITIFLRF
jgi:hypothetical protein